MRISQSPSTQKDFWTLHHIAHDKNLADRCALRAAEINDSGMVGFGEIYKVTPQTVRRAERFFDRHVVHFEELTPELSLQLIPLLQKGYSQKTRDALHILKIVRTWHQGALPRKEINA